MNLDRELAVTSPMMHGKDVEHAQKMLSSKAPGTKFGDFRPGKVDGVYGPRCGMATRRAKYWLGWPKEGITSHYGQVLENLLGGDDSLPGDFKKRREARLKQAAATPMRERAFAKAVGEIGTKEHPPDSNRVKYSSWYGIIGSWCAMFVTWCYVEAGSKETFRKGQRYAFVPFMVDDARGRDWHLVRITKDSVARGDIVTFDWEGGGVGGAALASDHVGLFDSWINKSAGTFRTVEGNTAIGNDSNGGEVMRRDRNMSQVSCFMRAEV